MQQFIDRAIDLVTFERAHALSHSIGFEMMAMWPGEVESLDISRNLRITLEKDILDNLPRILTIAESVLCDPKSSQLLDHFAVGAVKAYINSGGLSLSGIFEDRRAILEGACRMLQFYDSWRVKQSCGFLQDLAEVSEFPPPPSRETALSSIQESISRCSAVLSQFFSKDHGSDGIALDICNCVSALVAKDAAFFVSYRGFDINFMSILLGCTRQRPRKIAAVTFDAWLSIQDVPTIDRHDIAKFDLFCQLLGNILEQVMYPANFTSWDDSVDDDEDDFTAFRDLKLGIQEVVIVIFYALREHFFIILSEKIKEALSVDISVSWNIIEAVLYIVQVSNYFLVLLSIMKSQTDCPIKYNIFLDCDGCNQRNYR
jgi:hypothetical protein